jgi:putative glutamine amidotransferase
MSSDKKTENSDKTITPIKRIRRWIKRISVVLVALISFYVLFRLIYPVWINTRLPADAPRIAFSLDNSLLGRIGITDVAYQRVVTVAGGRLITLRPDAAGVPVSEEKIETLLEKEKIDGVLLTGGGDVDPSLYGGDPNTTLRVHRLRDDFEIALIHKAKLRGLPILGICRGCQILNVALGGTLRNLRKEQEVKGLHLALNGHAVDLNPTSELAETLGVTHLEKAFSLHGNSVGKTAAEVKVAATGPGDIIEAIEANSADHKGWIVGIQWHPELTFDKQVQQKIFKSLVDRARIVRDHRR